MKIDIKKVIRERGDINKATKHNISLDIDRTKRNLPNVKDI
jgi:hypothetical protein